jgi:hypothetical protein
MNTVKYFLAVIVVWTGAVMASEPPDNSVVLGTIEMWSDWRALDSATDLEKLCGDVLTSYNDLNGPRGYWGRLLKPGPVRLTVRHVADQTEQQFFCHLEVFKFVPAKIK